MPQAALSEEDITWQQG